MKISYRLLLNLFSFALLLVALYLNFIKKDNGPLNFPTGTQSNASTTTSVNKAKSKVKMAPSDGTLVLR